MQPNRRSGVSHAAVASSCLDERAVSQKKLLDQLADQIRVRHLAVSTDWSRVGWVRRFIVFQNKRHPKAMGARAVTEFLAHLIVDNHGLNSAAADPRGVPVG